MVSDRNINRPNNARQGHCMHFCSPSFTQCTGARFESRPGGENIIHNKDNFALEPARRLDRAANVPATFRGREASLALAALHTGKRARFPSFVVRLRNGLG